MDSTPGLNTAVPAPIQWQFEAQHGFFSHDNDPESWEFRATTQPKLGILDRSYPTDAEFDPNHDKSQWERLAHYVTTLNTQDAGTKKWKIFYIIRHGEGVHNVKEKEYGRAEWDVSRLFPTSSLLSHPITNPKRGA